MSKRVKRHPALFLDRDGTVNVDRGPGYLNSPEEVALIPGAARALIRAHEAGFKIALITNQAGVAKGITKKEMLPLIHKRLEELVMQETGAHEFAFDDIRICCHHPNDNCQCRKPEAALLEESIEALQADVSRSFFVGDKASDIACGNRMGLHSILVLTGHGVASQEELKDAPLGDRPKTVAPSLNEAVNAAIKVLSA